MSRTPSKSIVLLLAALAGAVLLGGSVIIIPWWITALLALPLVLAALVLRGPWYGLLGVAFLLPFERVGAIETSFGTIRLSQIVALLTLGAWVMHQLWHQRRIHQPFPIFTPLLLFVGVNILGLTFAANKHYGAEVLGLTIFTMLVCWLVTQLVTTEHMLVRCIQVVLVSATIVSLFGMFQFFGDFIGLPTSVTGLRALYTKEVFGFPRIQSTALEPLYFANYLLLPLSIVLALYASRKTILPRWTSFLLFGLFGANLVLTVSRGGYLGFGVAVLAIIVLSFKRFVRPPVFVPLLVGILAVGFFTVRVLNFDDLARNNIDTFVTHIQGVFSGASFNERAETIDQASQAFWSSPLIGIGPGNFGPYVAPHPLVKPDTGWLIVNNETFELLAETGILGLLSLLVAIAIVVVRSIKALLRPASTTLAAIHVGLFAAFMGILAQYQTFSTLYIVHVWFVLGLLIATQTIILRQRDV